MKAFVVGVYAILGVGLQVASAQPLSDDRVIAEISRLLQWKLFWEGPQSIARYEQGKTIDATVVSSMGEIAVFIGGIQVTAYLAVDGDQITNRTIGGMSTATVEKAIARYVSAKEGQPGFALKPGAPEQPPGTPIRRATPNGQNEASFESHQIHFRLPQKAAPEHIASRKNPAELDSLVSGARAKISGYHDPRCTKTTATVPLFSTTDPTVFVYVDFGPGCETGIFPFRWSSTHWTAGQFSPNRPPNDWAYTISQIRRYRLFQFSLP